MYIPARLSIQCAACGQEMDIKQTFHTAALKEITYVVDSCLCETKDQCKDCEDLEVLQDTRRKLQTEVTKLKLQLKGVQLADG